MAERVPGAIVGAADEVPTTDDFVEPPSHLPYFDATNLTEIPEIERLYATYRIGFDDPQATNAEHMARAKPLAIAILEHYYPKNQGYTIKPTALAPLTTHPWPILLDKKRAQAAAKKAKTSLARMPQFDTRNAIDSLGTGQYYHLIDPADIAGLAVWSELDVHVQQPDGAGVATQRRYVLHTVLAIVMDDLRTFDQCVADAKLPRGMSTRAEVLSLELGLRGGIREGYGFVLLGPRLEVYAYKREVWMPKATEKEAEAEEGKGGGFRRAGATWAVDMRTVGLDGVDRLVRSVCERDVGYWNGMVGPGPRCGGDDGGEDGGDGGDGAEM